eukprot:6192294-Amphidinium_carterae.1
MFETGWSISVRDIQTSKYCILEIRFSQQLRAAASGGGETLFKLLLSTVQPPDDVQHVFPCCMRLVETDEHGANGRCERMLKIHRGPQWSSLTSLCLAHKVHAMAQKTWTLESDCVSAIIQVCKHLSSSGMMAKLKESMVLLAAERFEVRPALLLTPGAKTHKDNIQAYFLPPLSRSRCRATTEVAVEFFSGDWRLSNTLIHQCAGSHCCKDARQSKLKAIVLLQKLCTVLTPRMFSRANWCDWAQTLNFLGVLSGLHSLLQDAFTHAFSKADSAMQRNSGVDHPDAEADTGRAIDRDPVQSVLTLFAHAAQGSGVEHAIGAEDDEQEAMRAELARALRLSLSWMSTGIAVFQQVFLLRVPLAPEVTLMHAMLGSFKRWEQQAMLQEVRSSVRPYRFIELQA